MVRGKDHYKRKMVINGVVGKDSEGRKMIVDD